MDMLRYLRSSAWALPAATLAFLSTVTSTANAANLAGFAYNSSLTNVETYGHATGLLIAGRCNRDHQKFKDARAGGAEVIVYIDPIEVPTTTACAMDDEFYHPNGQATPLWPYGPRTNYQGWPLTDITAGSDWSDRVVSYIEALMTNPDIDGVMLDVVGARLWSSESQWNSWPQAEKNAWTEGNIDLVRRLDESRRAINPRFIVVNNNFWDRGDAAGFVGEQYVDGIVSENHAWVANGYHANYVAKPFSNLGHRRLIAIATSATDAVNWSAAPGVTHVSKQYTGSSYGFPPAASPGDFTRLTDRPKTFGRTTVATTPASGMSANMKRGSKFTLGEQATLLSFSAYLDGNGGASGTQAIRMVLYRDSGGVPAAKVAESNTMNVTSGSAGQWYTFTAPAAALTPGTYWVVIHSGATATLARNFRDGVSNWYGNTDTFSDGSSDPFGAGGTGTGTLSVYVSYTVGN